MSDPNDNLKRLLFALHRLVKNKRSAAALQALMATDILLTFFLFGRDYFGWWPNVLADDENSALLAFMICLSFAMFIFMVVLAILYSAFQPKSLPRQPLARVAQPTRRLFLIIFSPGYYGLPVLWGRAELTSSDPNLWGTLAVAYAVAFQGSLFILVAAQEFTELRRKHQHRRNHDRDKT